MYNDSVAGCLRVIGGVINTMDVVRGCYKYYLMLTVDDDETGVDDCGG